MLKLPRRLYPIPSSAAAGLFSSFFSLQISLLILWIKPDLAMPKWIKFRRSFFSSLPSKRELQDRQRRQRYPHHHRKATTIPLCKRPPATRLNNANCQSIRMLLLRIMDSFALSDVGTCCRRCQYVYVDDEGRWLERPFFPNQSFVLSQLSIMRQHRTTAILLYYYYYLCKSSPYSLFHLHFTTHCASQKKRPLKGLNVETTLFFSSSDMRSFLKTFLLSLLFLFSAIIERYYNVREEAARMQGGPLSPCTVGSCHLLTS